MNEKLFNEMIEAIENKQRKEVEFLVAQREAKEAITAYKEYILEAELKAPEGEETAHA